MNVIGIIAEYNPFHRGHAYQIEEIRKQAHADYVIVCMSGNSVQRGAPALMEKYVRTEMALRCGADLVLELPVVYAAASAEFFARGGVDLLHQTGVVTHLCFGAEHDNLRMLSQISSVLTRQPPLFREELQKRIKSGLSFPLARAQALEAYLCSRERRFSQGQAAKEDLRTLLGSPNNILAIEYLKALSLLAPDITPVPILRRGRGYHDICLSASSQSEDARLGTAPAHSVLSAPGTAPAESLRGDDFCSASAIRRFLFSGQAARGTKTASFDERSPLAGAMPPAALKLLDAYPFPFLQEDDFSAIIHYKLLTESCEQLAEYADCSRELAFRLHRARFEFHSWTQFCRLLKTKNITHTRISRLLVHLLLDLKSEFPALSPSSAFGVPYLRVLGFHKSAAPLLHSIRKRGTAPLVTSPAKALPLLSPDARLMLEKDIAAADIYQLGIAVRGGSHLLNEYQHPILAL